MSDPDLIRLRADVEMIGTERLVKYAIAGGDTASEAVDLIVAFAMLRYCSADAPPPSRRGSGGRPRSCSATSARPSKRKWALAN